jgi:hypothetical protein
MPKTHLLSANHYELEILRLLALWGADNDQVAQMVYQSLKRLDATCFGHFCSEGECIGASIATLRLLSAVRPVNNTWIEEILKPLGDIFSRIMEEFILTFNLFLVFSTRMRFYKRRFERLASGNDMITSEKQRISRLNSLTSSPPPPTSYPHPC